MGNDRSVSEEVCRSPSALLSPVFSDAGCGMLVGSFLWSVFLFPFLPYSISCVFTVLFPYTSGIFLYMCDYWSCIIGWVCLTMARVLCSPSDLYMLVHPMCNNHCIAFDVSPPLWLSLRLAFHQPWPFFENLHLLTTLRRSCHIWSKVKNLGKICFGTNPV